jgi:hypothetical protein
MSADLLREAAEGARHIATMPPGVGLAIAHWLDACAAYKEEFPLDTHDGEDYAENVARLILGRAS